MTTNPRARVWTALARAQQANAARRQLPGRPARGCRERGVTKVKLYTEFNWKGYCRSVSHGTSTLARSARLCLLLDGNTPSKMRGDCERQMASGAMLQESYGVNMDAIDRVEEGFNRGEQTHQVATPFGDWQDLGGGGHMRRSHIRHRGE